MSGRAQSYVTHPTGMSAADLVTAEDLVDLHAPRLEEPPCAHYLDRAADAIGRLRRRHPNPDEYDRILLERAAASLDAIDATLAPCAAELVADGFGVDEALELIDRHTRAFHKRLGGRP